MHIVKAQLGYVAVIALGTVSACDSNRAPHDGGGADLTFVESTADRGSIPDGTDGVAEVSTPVAVHDCFPECVKALRADCERPPINGGYCEMVHSSGGFTYCYSNGVREVRTEANGGALVVITEPDGQTACYQISIDYSTGVEHFQTNLGQEVAQVAPADGGLYAVTCNGTAQVVDPSDSACATLDSTDCNVVVTACP